mmetsp:Transcript_15589/g.33884  ORF Transcript_15589/g.33884 Transcript_15589/m.33884 type:complete len:267 (+) Transcript_15589:920-1720(+)
MQRLRHARAVPHLGERNDLPRRAGRLQRWRGGLQSPFHRRWRRGAPQLPQLLQRRLLGVLGVRKCRRVWQRPLAGGGRHVGQVVLHGNSRVQGVLSHLYARRRRDAHRAQRARRTRTTLLHLRGELRAAPAFCRRGYERHHGGHYRLRGNGLSRLQRLGRVERPGGAADQWRLDANSVGLPARLHLVVKTVPQVPAHLPNQRGWRFCLAARLAVGFRDDFLGGWQVPQGFVRHDGEHSQLKAGRRTTAGRRKGLLCLPRIGELPRR